MAGPGHPADRLQRVSDHRWHRGAGHRAAVRRRRPGRQRRAAVVADPAVRLCRCPARRCAVLRHRPPLPPGHPPPAAAASPSGMAGPGRVLLPALRGDQPAARPLHRPAATDAADRRRHARHAAAALRRGQPGGGGRLGGGLPAARLDDRRSPAPAAAGRLLVAGRGAGRRPARAARPDRPGQPARAAHGGTAGRGAERNAAARPVRRLGAFRRLRPGAAGADATRTHAGAGPVDGAPDPARRLRRATGRRPAAGRPAGAAAPVARPAVRRPDPGRHRTGQPGTQAAVRPPSPGTSPAAAGQLQPAQRAQLGGLRPLPGARRAGRAWRAGTHPPGLAAARQPAGRGDRRLAAVSRRALADRRAGRRTAGRQPVCRQPRAAAARQHAPGPRSPAVARAAARPRVLFVLLPPPG